MDAIDKRTDIWAFGCVLYEMLDRAGAAFPGDDRVRHHRRNPRARTRVGGAARRDCPPAVAQLLRRCLEKDPKRRLRDIGDAHSFLDAPDAAISRTRTTTATTRNHWPRLLLGAAMLTGILAASIALWNRRTGETTALSAASGQQFVRVTTDAALSMEPTVSRDGTMIRLRLGSRGRRPARSLAAAHSWRSTHSPDF